MGALFARDKQYKNENIFFAYIVKKDTGVGLNI